MTWTEGHLALVLASTTSARAQFFGSLSAAAIARVRPAPQQDAVYDDESQDELKTETPPVGDEKSALSLGQDLKDLCAPQVLIVSETVFALSQKNFAEPKNLKIFIEKHNSDMRRTRRFYGGFTEQGVSKTRYEKAIFGKRAIDGALFHWRGQKFRCDISFLQHVLGPQMSPKTCADTIDLLVRYGFLIKEPAGSSSLITSTGTIEALVETYLDTILEYGAMAKCLKSKNS